MRIANVKKFVRSILIVLGVIFSLTLFISKSSFSHGETEYKTIYVSDGDTLWNIAKANQLNNGYYKNKDVRYIINDLIEVNELKNTSLYIDQELIVPTI